MELRRLWRVDLLLVIMALLRTISSAKAIPAEVQVSEERRLIRDLLARYEKLGTVARPTINSSETVQVEFGLRLVHLDIDEKEQLMKTSAWIRMKWFDDYLKWDPMAYGRVTSVTIPADKVWTPDIVLVNAIGQTSGGSSSFKEQPAALQVKFMGRVFWAPQRVYSSACLIDVTEYPYDRHTCHMWFQSLSNYDYNVNITQYKPPLDLDTYLTSYKYSQEWEILENSTIWCDRPVDYGVILMYSRRAALRFTLGMQRKAGFKGMILIVPCALLSFLVPLVFCFPPERPDRHTLAMSLFASLTILLFMVNDVAPPSASFVPRLALYYSFNLLVLLLATCCSAVVVNLSRRGENRVKVPRWVRLVFIRWLAKILCFGNRIQHIRQVRQMSRRNRKQKHQRGLENGQHSPRSSSPPVHTTPESFPGEACLSDVESQDHPVLVVLNKKLSTIENRLQNQHQQQQTQLQEPDVSIPIDVRMEWRFLSLVLDRLFFVVFLLIDFISLSVFHPRAT